MIVWLHLLERRGAGSLGVWWSPCSLLHFLNLKSPGHSSHLPTPTFLCLLLLPPPCFSLFLTLGVAVRAGHLIRIEEVVKDWKKDTAVSFFPKT